MISDETVEPLDVEPQKGDNPFSIPNMTLVDDNTTLATVPPANPNGNQDFDNPKQAISRDDIETFADETKLFKCSECGKSFTQKYNLNRHRKMKHQPVKTKSIKIKVQSTCNDKLEGSFKRTLRQQYRWKVLECNVCGQRFSDNRILATHMLMHQKENEEVVENTYPLKGKENKSLCQQYCRKVLECNVCGQTFSQNKILTKHMLEHQKAILHFQTQESIKNYSGCLDDVKTSKMDDKLENEKTSDSAKTNTPKVDVNGLSNDHLCQVCGKNFSKDANLKRHIRTVHEGVKDFECKVCGKTFSEKKAMINHERVIHQGIKAFKCKVCGVQFGSRCNLTRHAKTHQGIKPYNCEKCDMRFLQKSDLLKHSVVHTGIKAFQCQICGKKFAHKTNLSKHRFVHTVVKAFQCKICGTKLKTKDSLKKHQVVHDGTKPFSCNICEKRFSRRSNLLQHRVVHTGVKAFECKICGKRFSRKSNLSTHSLIHSSRYTKYKCDLHGKTFSSKSNLERHKKIVHEGIKAFKCEVCDMSFGEKVSLKRHVARKHDK